MQEERVGQSNLVSTHCDLCMLKAVSRSHRVNVHYLRNLWEKSVYHICDQWGYWLQPTVFGEYERNLATPGNMYNATTEYGLKRTIYRCFGNMRMQRIELPVVQPMMG